MFNIPNLPPEMPPQLPVPLRMYGGPEQVHAHTEGVGVVGVDILINVRKANGDVDVHDIRDLASAAIMFVNKSHPPHPGTHGSLLVGSLDAGIYLLSEADKMVKLLKQNVANQAQEITRASIMEKLGLK